MSKVQARDVRALIRQSEMYIRREVQYRRPYRLFVYRSEQLGHNKMAPYGVIINPYFAEDPRDSHTWLGEVQEILNRGEWAYTVFSAGGDRYRGEWLGAKDKWTAINCVVLQLLMG